MARLGHQPPTVTYDIKAILRPLAGRSYLGFTCTHCGAPVAMLQGSGSGGGALASARVEVKCPTCGVVGHYDTKDLSPYHA